MARERDLLRIDRRSGTTENPVGTVAVDGVVDRFHVDVVDDSPIFARGDHVGRDMGLNKLETF